MNLNRLIKTIMPHGLYCYIMNRRSKDHYHINDLFDMEISTNFEINTKMLPNQIVSVQGFGYSGSGAVIDIMREYECNIVWGAYDIENSPEIGKKTIKQCATAEIDILRLSGGLLELEKYITEQNVFIKDAAIRRFITLVESWIRIQPKDSILLSKEFKETLLTFLNSLIDFKINVGDQNPYNYHLYINCNSLKNYIFFLKDISIDEYLSNAKLFLKSIFSMAGKAQNLIVDQFCMDFKCDLNHLNKYVDNLKIIQVTRDPRDVYMTAIQKKISWIPTASSKDFIKWYKICHKCLIEGKDTKEMIFLRFEDIVYDYDRTIEKIEFFLNLSESKHIHKLVYFDPSISQKNIGIWRDARGNEKLFVKDIYEALPEFCYNPFNIN